MFVRVRPHVTPEDLTRDDHNECVKLKKKKILEQS